MLVESQAEEASSDKRKHPLPAADDGTNECRREQIPMRKPFVKGWQWFVSGRRSHVSCGARQASAVWPYLTFERPRGLLRGCRLMAGKKRPMGEGQLEIFSS